MTSQARSATSTAAQQQQQPPQPAPRSSAPVPPTRSSLNANNNKQQRSNSSDNNKNDIDFYFKVILLGDTGVGKTSVLNRFSSRKFTTEHKPTIGVEFGGFTRVLHGDKCTIQVWDTAGEERFKSLTKTYFRGAHGVIIVYDVSKYSSYTSATQTWLPLLMEHDPGFADGAVIMLIGNKSDLADQQVKLADAVAFAQANRVHMAFHTSASDGSNVEDAFNKMFEALHSRARKSKLVPKPDGPARTGGTSQANMRAIALQDSGRDRNKCAC